MINRCSSCGVEWVAEKEEMQTYQCPTCTPELEYDLDKALEELADYLKEVKCERNSKKIK
jgi:predicted RNA-binding Zn-ribbon protein involved in translation (DUF1610 family)